MNGKLFRHVRVDLTDDVESALTKALEAVVLTFSLMWTPGVAAGLYALHVREENGPWRTVIPNIVGDNDGEISVLLGSFPPVVTIEIFFGVLAVSARIQRAATFVVMDSTTPFKLSPSNPADYKTIERTEKWEDTCRYKVRDQLIA